MRDGVVVIIERHIITEHRTARSREIFRGRTVEPWCTDPLVFV
jgi:hypothetical protein